MADTNDAPLPDGSTRGATEEGEGEAHESLNRRPPRPGRDDRLDADLEAERLEPGLRTDGEGDTGADPSRPHSDGNSNT